MPAPSVPGLRAPIRLLAGFCVFLALVQPARAQGVDAAIKAGRALEDAGKLDEAVAEYGRAIAADPSSASGWLRRGIARVKAKQYEPALQDFDRAIAIDPSVAEAHKGRASALSGLLRFKEAVEAATASLQIDASYSPAYYHRGFAKFRLYDFAGSVDDESRAIQANPENWEAFRIRGVARVELKQYSDALADLDVALAHEASNPASTYHYRAIARHALGDSKGAVEDENRTIEMNPSYAKGYAGLGIYKAAIGDRAGAEAAFRKALALDPNERAASAGLARLGVGAAGAAAPPTPAARAPATPSGASPPAGAAGRNALPPLDPSEVPPLSAFANEQKLLAAFRASPTAEAREALARVRFEHAMRLAELAEKKLDEQTHATALGYAESAVALAPDNHAAWLLLGRLYAAIEENPVAAGMAEQAFRAALEVKPGLPAACLGLAQLYLRRGSFDRVLNELEPVVSASPALATPEVVSMMGWSYLSDFQLDRGVKFLRDLSGRNPKVEPLAIGLAVLLHESGSRLEAERALTSLVKNASAAADARGYAKALLEDWAKGGAR